MQRILRQREMLDTIRHDNEVLLLDLTREKRDAKDLTGGATLAEITR